MAHRDINRNEVDIEIDMTKVEMGQLTINMYTEANQKGTEDGSGATRTPTEVENDEMEALTHSLSGRAAAPKRMMSCRTRGIPITPSIHYDLLCLQRSSEAL